MFAYQGKKIIGSYAAAMEGVDVIVFTAGIGENTDHMRKAMCEGLEFMGVEFDDEANNGLRGKEAIISKPTSKVTVCVIPTNEELAIAQETERLVR
jgi:acetate kinase